MILDGVDLHKLLAYVKEDGSDGWIIWKPEYFTAMGFKREVLPIETFVSSKTDSKWAITHKGKNVDKVTGGVWNLAMLVRIADAIGVGDDYDRHDGRGSQASAISAVIIPRLDWLARSS